MTDFDGVTPTLGQALSNRGYNTLTPVQIAMIAPELADRDALVSAQTGSGKTVAFGLAIAPTLLGEAETFDNPDAPLALIVAPTRELALQVTRELEWLFAQTGAVITSCVGGMDMRDERRALGRGAHIVVGTPGRLCDHVRRNSLDTSMLRALVLDEADEMLDLGFREDLEFILEATPAERRTLMFSATVPTTIANLAKKYQQDAVRVSTAEEKQQHLDIEYRALSVSSRERENAIINVLRYYDSKNVLVFCNTRATVNHMVARFNNRGFAVVALSGELTQNERAHALQAMRDGRARVCIATDVAARGIDLPNLELVIHAQLPTNPEILVHRSGRTGRAGRKGVSVMIVDHKARKRAERLLRDAKLSATWAAPPSADEVRQRDEERMLADPALSEPARDNEQAFIARLLADHAPAQLAAAFMRLYQAGQSAPEELEDSTGALADMLATGRPDRASTKQRRDDFGPSIWMSLSVGRNQNAEPRWLIPLLCNAGNITKNEIGLIKMQNDETFVQLKADHADGFFAILGPNPTLDKGIRAKRLESAPSFNSDSGGRSDSRRKPEFRDKKPHRGKSGDGEQKFHKPRKPRAEQEDRRPSDAKRSGSITKSFGERSENPLGKKKHEGRKAGAPSFEDREKPKPAKKGPPRGKSKGKDAGKPGVHYKKSRGSDLANPAKRVSRPKRPAS